MICLRQPEVNVFASLLQNEKCARKGAPCTVRPCPQDILRAAERGREEGRRVLAGGKPAFTFSVCFSFRRVKQSGAYQPVAAAPDALCDELSALLFVMRNCDKCDVLPKERH